MERTRWYKDTFVYQIYPRSFCDSNGDGVGDIRGIISKLDYLQELGITAVWLSPCYKSPNDDNGYDISDYRDIMDEFGTLEDWQEMVDGMHARGIKLIMDLVVNHSSDEHFWFKEALKGKDNPYRDYYIWRKGRGKDGKKVPNNWTSRFGGTAWEYDEASGEFYLHLFTKKQPDLNWDNPKVRQEVHGIVKYWLDKGCDGFRCDVITYISKKEGLPNGKLNIGIMGDEHFTHGPNIHPYLNALNKEVLSKYDCMTVGEGPGMDVKNAIDYTAEEREELDTVFTFEHMNSDAFLQIIPRKFKLSRLKKIFANYQYGLRDKGWNSLFFENHDQPRSLPRYTGDYGDKRKEAAKMLATALYMQQGTPYCYEGQELGMTNYPWKNIDEFQDVMVKSVLKVIDKYLPFLRGLVFKIMKSKGRDNGRTPMQWDASENAGFTTGTPWLPVNPDYTEINVAAQQKDPDSILNYYKKLIKFRLGNQIIKSGTFSEHYASSDDIYCYERSFEGEKIMVICNFKNAEIPFVLPSDAAYASAQLVLHNYEDERKLESMTLKPYEAMIFHIK